MARNRVFFQLACLVASVGCGSSDGGTLVGGNPDSGGPNPVVPDPAQPDGGTPPVVDPSRPDVGGTPANAPPADSVAYQGTYGAGSGTYTLTVQGVQRSVLVAVPSTRSANPPLVVGLHGTGGNAALEYSMQELGLIDGAERYGYVLVAPASTDDGGANADHEDGGTGWSFEPSEQNPDLLLVRAAIEQASVAYGIDRTRVYVAGHSNGAFFSTFVAMKLADRVAAFAENAGGFIPCGRRVDCTATAPGATSCAAIDAAGSSCKKSACVGGSFPTPKPSGRTPSGYLVHAADDSIVSPYFTCRLADVLGSRAQVEIRPSGDHGIGETFLPTMWGFFSARTLAD